MADDKDKTGKNESAEPAGAASKPQAVDEIGTMSKLMRLALRAFAVGANYVLSSRDYGDRVVIVTKGGKKVSYCEGMDVEKLTHTEASGEVPEHVRRAREASKKW